MSAPKKAQVRGAKKTKIQTWFCLKKNYLAKSNYGIKLWQNHSNYGMHATIMAWLATLFRSRLRHPFPECNLRIHQVKVHNAWKIVPLIIFNGIAVWEIVIVDEAHNRSLHCDLLKRQRSDSEADLQVIIMSAALNTKKIETFFMDTPLVHSPGFTHAVEIF